MRKTTLLLVVACGFVTVLLWCSFRPEPVDSVASERAEKTGPLTSTGPAEDASVRTHVVAPRPVTGDRPPPADTHTEEEVEAEHPIRLERSPTNQYPSEQDVSFRLRVRMLRLFDQFVEAASLTDEEIAALKVAVYDAQSEFAEIQRRPYVYVNRRRPKPPDWVVEASDDAEILRREFLRDVRGIVGKDRESFLDHTFVTTLEILPFRIFIKPGYAPIALIDEQPF